MVEGSHTAAVQGSADGQVPARAACEHEDLARHEASASSSVLPASGGMRLSDIPPASGYVPPPMQQQMQPQPMQVSAESLLSMVQTGCFGGSFPVPSPALVPDIAASGLPVEMEDTYAVQQNPLWDWTSMSGKRSSFPGAGPSHNDASDSLRRNTDGGGGGSKRPSGEGTPGSHKSQRSGDGSAGPSSGRA